MFRLQRHLRVSTHYRTYIESDEWRDIALRVKAAADFRCSVCNGQRNLNVHHRSYRNLGNERKHMGDLICLCEDCHTTHHAVMKERKAFGTVRMHTPSAVSAPIKRAVRPVTNPPMDGGMVVLNSQILQRLQRIHGPNVAKELGTKPNKGWMKRLVGEKITLELFRVLDPA